MGGLTIALALLLSACALDFSRKASQGHQDGGSNGGTDSGEGGTDSGGIAACPAGQGRGAEGCTDVDECATGSHNCPIGSECLDRAGTFACRCPFGPANVDPRDGTRCEQVAFPSARSVGVGSALYVTEGHTAARSLTPPSTGREEESGEEERVGTDYVISVSISEEPEKSGGPGDPSPGLPQIRACGFPALGSSVSRIGSGTERAVHDARAWQGVAFQ